MEILHSEHNSDLTEAGVKAALALVDEKLGLKAEWLALAVPEGVAYSAGLFTERFGMKGATVLPSEMAKEDSWALVFDESPVFYSPGA